MEDLETIFALSSGSGAAGVAVIRVSGDAVGTVLDRMVPGSAPQPRVATLRTIRDPESSEVLDQGIVLFMPGPKSFTGEDCLELHVHGGRAVTRAVLNALEKVPGLRVADAGEFTRRAFERGRMDLTSVEGLGELVAAETEAQRKLALRVASGALEKIYLDMRGDIVEARAFLESQIDFSDEDDVAEIDTGPVRQKIDSVRQRIAALLSGAPAGRVIREGFRVVLAGAPNVGKSSLLNYLAGREAAIVAVEAGTTRDIVEVRLELNGQLVLLQDVAGIREAAGAVEAEGIRRAREALLGADLVIALESADAPFPRGALDSVIGTVLKVWAKNDISAEPNDSVMKHEMSISVKSGVGLAGLTARLASAAADAAVGIDSVAVHLRHVGWLSAADMKLAGALSYLSRDEWEFGADCLRAATDELDVLLGRIGVEDVLDVIFSRFCIGK
ncbi:MAG: tRNA uridine-5-carboxymethylaminomethyl(34) synthesis GTPase MnmE [Rhodobiaceae bacterium]|nr:tRNA uridine-5-carboxymethylaminomethyl(34) synthesis GTPase MnmE [Rhodobiaceae bacterium]MCC0055446.1 tRNA uridine-5-carboxymethylaminomethyl(34) synthesis GTPase MnmE [Rhodobiaceae bacterium]